MKILKNPVHPVKQSNSKASGEVYFCHKLLSRCDEPCRLVLRHTRIDVFRPRGDAAFQVDQFAGIARTLKRLDCFRTAHAAFAVNDRLNL